MTNAKYELTDTPASISNKRSVEAMLSDCSRGTLTRIYNTQLYDDTIVMLTILSCSTQIYKVLVFLLQSDVDPHIETRGIVGLSGERGIYTFMYIIIYIINYNEYIVMYNIESHSLTITSTT